MLVKEGEQSRDDLSGYLVNEPVTGPGDDHALDIVGDQPTLRNEEVATRFSPPSTNIGIDSLLQENDIRISMDGKGCWRDNVFVERLWKTIKYEHVYLHAYDSVSDARCKLAGYLDFYNRRRPHTALAGRTPDDVCFSSLPLQLAA